MITRVGIAPRAAGLSHEECQRHWRGVHADAALGIPGLRAYTQNHAVLRDGRPLLPYPGFDVCAETQFDDLAAMDEGFASPHYRGAVRDDETLLIDGSRFLLAVCERRVLADGAAPEGAVKLMTFMRAIGGRETLARVLEGEYADAAGEAEPLRHEQLISLPAAHGDGRPDAACDAIDILWFASPDRALDALLGPLAERPAWLLAGHAFGSERLVARPNRVR